MVELLSGKCVCQMQLNVGEHPATRTLQLILRPTFRISFVEPRLEYQGGCVKRLR